MSNILTKMYNEIFGKPPLALNGKVADSELTKKLMGGIFRDTHRGLIIRNHLRKIGNSKS